MRRVLSAATKRKIVAERLVWDVLNIVVDASWKSTSGAQRSEVELSATRYPIAADEDEESLSVQSAECGGQDGDLDPCKVYIRASVEIEKYGTTPGYPGYGAILTDGHKAS